VTVVLDASAGINLALGRLEIDHIGEIAHAAIAVPSLYVTEVGASLARLRADGGLSMDEVEAHRVTALGIPDEIVRNSPTTAGPSRTACPATTPSTSRWRWSAVPSSGPPMADCPGTPIRRSRIQRT
jgi:hypothetical protein